MRQLRYGQPQRPEERVSALVHIPGPDGRVPFRIVAYGDSLTAGAPAMESYAKSLARNLVEAGTAVEVTVCGLCGTTAREMLLGAQEPEIPDAVFGRWGAGIAELVRAKPGAWRAADLALVMAGTNDLGVPMTRAEDLTTFIRGLHEACHAAGVRTVALAIPDAGGRSLRKFGAEYPARRRAVNAALSAWAREEDADDQLGSGQAPRADRPEIFAGTDGGDSVPSLETYLAALDDEEGAGLELPRRPDAFVNTVALLPIGPRSRAAGFWEKDGVHFTALGSEVLGARIAALIAPLVSRLQSKALLGKNAELGADGDGAPPSLEAYLAAFDFEDEEALDEKHAGAMQAADPPEWEAEAASHLQHCLRSLKTRGAAAGGKED